MDQFPLFAELDLGAGTSDGGVPLRRTFSGTDNPRHLRVIRALMLRPRTREEIDRIAGASNGPELIAELGRRGLHTKCERTRGIDRDGRPTKFGIYQFDEEARRAVNAWLRTTKVSA
jgi:hypothetical protein